MALFGTKKDKDQKEEVKEEKKETSMKDLYEGGAAPKKVAAKGKKSPSRYEGAYRILIKPLVTEKAADLNTISKYAFAVSTSANKIEIAKAVQAVYGVKPEAVNIISMKGKAVTRGRQKGRRKDWKKAIVTLKKGDSIKIYEGV